MLETLDIFFTRRAQDRIAVETLAARTCAVRLISDALDTLVAELDVAGLHEHPDGRIEVGRPHRVELFFPPVYPVETGPVVRLATPGVRHVHPNVDPVRGFVCWGMLEPDRWAPSIGVDDVLLIVARMLRLEIYNLDDGVRGAEAAAEHVAWLAGQGRTPLDDSPLWSAVVSDEIVIGPEDDDVIEI